MLPDVPRRVGPVTGLGISRVDFDFKIFASSNVLVIRTSKAGVDKTLKEGEDYTVTWDEDQTANIGGYITLDEFLTDGESVTILSNVAYTQELDLHAEGDFNPNDINVNFDRTEAQIQQLKEKLSRAAVAPASSGMEGEEYGEILLENSTKSGEYAAQAQQSADAAAASASSAAVALSQVNSHTDAAINARNGAIEAASQALANSHQTRDDRIICQNALETVRGLVTSAGFSLRSHPSIIANETVPISNVSPSSLIKVGDLILSKNDGNLFSVIAVTDQTITVGSIVANLRGPRGERGLQGSPGPAGSVGPQGPMGQSPYATCFGQFQVNESGMLQLEYVGLAPAEFSINDNGEVEANYANT